MPVATNAVRLSLLFALVFAFVAVQMAYWPLWLRAGGVDETALGLLLGFGFLAKIVVNPLFRRFASHARNTRNALAATAAMATLVFVAFAFVDAMVALVLVQLVFFVFWIPVMPTTEFLVVDRARRDGFDYGRVRMWGSVSFLLATVVVGAWLERRGIGATHGVAVVLLVGFVLAALASPPGSGAGNTVRGFSARRVSAVPGMVDMLVVAGLVQGSHAMFFGFGSIHFQSLGIGEATIGLLWAVGIGVEIAVFLLGGVLPRALGATGLLAVGGVAATLRWALLPVVTSPTWLLLLQSLHGISFAATHLGAIAFISSRVPESLGANALAMYSMVVMGGFMGLAVLTAGFLYGRYGADAFWAMAVYAGVGTVLALVRFAGQTPRRRPGEDDA